MRVEGDHHFAILKRCKDHLIGRPRIALIAIAIDLLSQSTKTKWIKSTELREEQLLYSFEVLLDQRHDAECDLSDHDQWLDRRALSERLCATFLDHWDIGKGQSPTDRR